MLIISFITLFRMLLAFIGSINDEIINMEELACDLLRLLGAIISNLSGSRKR